MSHREPKQCRDEGIRLPPLASALTTHCERAPAPLHRKTSFHGRHTPGTLPEVRLRRSPFAMARLADSLLDSRERLVDSDSNGFGAGVILGDDVFGKTAQVASLHEISQ